MKRKEYMERLEQLLLVLSEEEREEALQYYTDYFEDAGLENEDSVIIELGSPEEVAAKIRAGFAEECGEYSEQGFEDIRFHKNQEIMVEAEKVEGTWEEMPQEENKVIHGRERNRNTNIWKIIAIILIVLIAAPVIFPLGIAVLAVVLSVLIAVIAIVFAVGVSGFAILFAGIMIIVAGIAKILLAPAIGILATGVGCILLAIGVLLSWIIVSILVKVVPGMIRGMVNILGYPFRKAGAR